MKWENRRYSVGHVLIKVENLSMAVEDFRKLGFTVTYGAPPEKATNAMIYFDDGSFLELFCTRFNKVVDSLMGVVLWILSLKDKAFADRYRNYLSQPEGFKDYALDSLLPYSFEENMEQLRVAGLSMSKPKKMKRTNAEGIRLSWVLCHTPYWQQPFFMSEYQPRLPLEKEQYTHANGAAHIHKLRLATSHWDQDIAFYGAILGYQLEIKGAKGKRHCSFRLGEVEMFLLEGTDDGIEELVLKGGRAEAAEPLDRMYSHGAAIIIEAGEKKI